MAEAGERISDGSVEFVKTAKLVLGNLPHVLIGFVNGNPKAVERIS